MLTKVWREGYTCTLLLEMKIDAIEDSKFLKKLKGVLRYDPDVRPEGNEITTLYICTPVFTFPLLTITNTWRQRSVHWQINDIVLSVYIKCMHMYVCICVFTEYYSAFKKMILSFAAIWMNLEDTLLREVRHRKKNTAWLHFLFMQKTVYYFMWDNG